MKKLLMSLALFLGLISMSGNVYAEDSKCENLSDNINIIVNDQNKFYTSLAKGMISKIMNEHLNMLCENNLDIEKILKEHPLEIEMFPNEIKDHDGFYFDKYTLYYHPEQSLGIVSYQKDRIVYVSGDIDYVLIHEFAHYIDYKLFNSEDMMDFLRIKNLHEDNEIVDKIRIVQGEWGKRPSEIFAENYVEFFTNKKSRMYPLKQEELKSFEEFISNNFKPIEI